MRQLIVHVTFVLLSAAMLWLGLWQLNRAEEKRTLLALAATSRDAPPVALSSVLGNIDEAAKRFSRVVFTGVWLPEKQLLWDNRVFSGKAGYEVLTPFQTDSGPVVLVNRGWVPIGSSRQRLPLITDGVLAGSSGQEVWSLLGVVTQPSKGLASGPAIEPSDTWPKRAQYLDYPVFAEMLELDVVPALIQSRLIEDPVEEPWHYVGNWEPTESFGPSRHLGYAVQWFALLATLVFLYLWYEIKLFRRFRGAKKSINSHE